MSVQKTVDRYKVWQITESCPEAAICDRGYRGRKKVGDTSVLIPGRPKKSDTPYQRRKARQRFRRRAGIEPVVGHLKQDFRMARSFLKGAIGDAINLFMAAAGYNFRRWMRGLSQFLSLFVAWLYFRLVRWGRLKHA
jgi:IS5 family transposase